MSGPWDDKEFKQVVAVNAAEADSLLAEGTDLRIQSITGEGGMSVAVDGNAISVSAPQGLMKGDSPTFKTISLSSMKQGSVLFISGVGGNRKVCQDNTNLAWDDSANALRVTEIQNKNYTGRRVLGGYKMGMIEDIGRYGWKFCQRLGTQSVSNTICYIGNGKVLSGTSALGRIYRSMDHGTSWIDWGPMITGEEHVACLSYLGNGIVIGGSRPLGKVGRSTDYGETWTSLGRMGSETAVMCSAYCGNGIVVIGTDPNGHIYRSTDYGATWADLGNMFSETKIACLEYIGGGVVLAGTYGVGKILRSVDYGASWIDVNQNYAFTQVYSLAYLEAGVVVAGTADAVVGGKILRSTDNGITWSDLDVVVAGETEIKTLEYVGNGVVLGGTYNGGKLIRSADYGLTWADLGQMITAENSVNVIRNIGDGVVLAGSGESASIYKCVHQRTPGNGVTWNPYEVAATADNEWHTLNIPGAKEVRLSVSWSSTTATHTMRYYTRRRGSSSGYEGIAAGVGRHSSMIVQACDNPTYPGDIEYKCQRDGGTVTVYVIGYIS